MPREIKMPKLSDTMEEGTLNVWRKAEGEAIAKGDVLLEIETDKADMEFEAYMSGRIERILVAAGETVAVGTPIAIVRLETDSDEQMASFLAARNASGVASSPSSEVSASTSVVQPPPAAVTAISSSPTPKGVAMPSAPPASSTATTPAPQVLELPSSRLNFFVPDPERIRATPRARVIAKEQQVDLSEIAGSGPGGAIVVSDVRQYLAHLEEETSAPSDGDVHVTPVALRIAEEMKLDLASVKGTGPGGRVTKKDLRDFMQREKEGTTAKAAELYGSEIKLSQKRKFLIRNMVESKQQVPHFYITREIDAAPLAAYRNALKQRGERATYTHLFIRAAALALVKYPEVNATYREDHIRPFVPANIAVAVDVQGELLAPVVKNCEGRSLASIVEESDRLIEKARDRKLTPEDYADGTLTISNLGMFGVDHFYAIITPPMSTVLAVGSLRTVVVPSDDAANPFCTGQRISFGLSVDHRVLDGVRASKFLAYFAELLEAPESMEQQVSGAP